MALKQSIYRDMSRSIRKQVDEIREHGQPKVLSMYVRELCFYLQSRKYFGPRI